MLVKIGKLVFNKRKFYLYKPMSKPKLTNADFCKAAKKLKCDVAAIKAVAHVESRGDGFYSNGFPTILFERHKFRTHTRGKYTKSHPHLSGPQGGYGPAGQNQRNKFSEAFELDPEAAMMSCSWGKFQVMGFNWEDLGYDSIHEFVDRMKISEGEHLDAFVRFVIKNGLKDELQRKDFKTFARVYNGPGYKENKYDTKMASFCKKFEAERINCDDPPKNPLSINPFAGLTDEEIELDIPTVSTAAKPQDAPTTGDTHVAVENTGNATQVTPLQDPPSNPISAENVQINEGSTASVAPANFVPEDKELEAPPKDGATATATKTAILGITVPASVYAVFEGIKSAAQDGMIDIKEISSAVVALIRENIKYVSILAGFIILVAIVKKAFKQVTFLLQMYIAARPDLHNVTIVNKEPDHPWWKFWR